jgi:small subunit ribosomal protein S5
MLKPAPRGSGIIAGGAVRAVLELAGVPNVSSKILARTKNKILLVKATFDALKKFKMRPTKIAPVQDLKVKIEVEDPNDKIVKIKKKANTEEAQA